MNPFPTPTTPRRQDSRKDPPQGTEIDRSRWNNVVQPPKGEKCNDNTLQSRREEDLAARLRRDAPADGGRRARERLGQGRILDVEHRPGTPEPSGQDASRRRRDLLRHVACLLPRRVGVRARQGPKGERLRPQGLRRCDEALQLRAPAVSARGLQEDVRGLAQVPPDGLHRQLPPPLQWQRRLQDVL